MVNHRRTQPAAHPRDRRYAVCARISAARVNDLVRQLDTEAGAETPKAQRSGLRRYPLLRFICIIRRAAGMVASLASAVFIATGLALCATRARYHDASHADVRVVIASHGVDAVAAMCGASYAAVSSIPSLSFAHQSALDATVTFALPLGAFGVSIVAPAISSWRH